MIIPGLGIVTLDKGMDDWYHSELISVPVLGGKKCSFIIAGYDEAPVKEDYHSAITNFLSLPTSILEDAIPHIFEYYEDIKSHVDDLGMEPILSPMQVMHHLQLGDTLLVTHLDGKGVYISLTCECDWEPERGLQIVFKNGLTINKVGPYGNMTNRPDNEDIVYQRIG